MVHNRVNKWSTFCFEFLEADVDHLLTLEFYFEFEVLKLDMFQTSHSSCRKKMIKIKTHTPKKTRKEMWTTYWPYKGLNVDHLLTLQHIYIHTYIPLKMSSFHCSVFLLSLHCNLMLHPLLVWTTFDFWVSLVPNCSLCFSFRFQDLSIFLIFVSHSAIISAPSLSIMLFLSLSLNIFIYLTFVFQRWFYVSFHHSLSPPFLSLPLSRPLYMECKTYYFSHSHIRTLSFSFVLPITYPKAQESFMPGKPLLIWERQNNAQT